MSLDALTRVINPKKTALLLGAGASVPSGAPSGGELAELLWRKLMHTEPQSDDLIDTSTILERRFGRKAIIELVVGALQNLTPTGGLLGLPKFQWLDLFTTNYDQTLEKAYKANGLPCTVIRSNYDFTNKETATGERIFKIHGCITQDEALGHKASMILTEGDYEKHKKYRQTMFSSLQACLLTGDVLVIGQSLRDRHLLDLVKEVLASKVEGAPGQIYVLVYDNDDLRAPLLEDRGAKVAFGGIDEFVHALASSDHSVGARSSSGSAADMLPLAIVSSVYDVESRAKASPNIVRMFNGGPASYADVRYGTTFQRAREADVFARLTSGNSISVTITGAAGVGKTTFARQIALKLADTGAHVWEQRSEFSFQYQPWIKVEADLRASGGLGFLLLDECTSYLRAANTLIDHLAGIDKPALRLLFTANSSQWAPRVKSPNIYTKGLVIELSRLEDAEIHALINLLQYSLDIAGFVHSDFRHMSRGRQFEALRQKCSADMFVCLKNIFANESLDTILLTEFDQLDPALQDYYRYVAALEAVGARVHRQLIIRMLAIAPTKVGRVLEGLTGIVDEYDIDPDAGIYGWSTRHLVIARKITDYKFSSAPELAGLFDRIISSINPAQRIELQTIRGICDADFGIGRLGDAALRQNLYKRLIQLVPGERIPWHRLIRELLAQGNLEETEYVIRDAEEAVGLDAPISRYKVRLLIIRAKKTIGISDNDRVALLRRAYELASKNIDHHRMDKLSYATLCDVAIELVRRGESEYMLDEAIERMQEASERIHDPDMVKNIRYYQDVRTHLR